MKEITIELPTSLLRRAQEATGKNIDDTLIAALEAVINTKLTNKDKKIIGIK